MVGAAIAILLRKDVDRRQLVLVLLGSIIIDLERPLSWILDNTNLYWIDLTTSFHSFLGALLLSIFVASFIDIESIEWRTRFYLVFSGAISHLIMDMTMWPWEEFGVNLLYPLKIAFSFQVFWPDFVWYPLLGMCILVVSVVMKTLQRYLIKVRTAKV